MESTKDEHDQTDKEAVRRLSRIPAKCPVGKCGETVFPSNLMMHMLDKHATPYENSNLEIYDHVPLLLSFEPKDFDYEDNRCVATLSYGGDKTRPETQPGLNYLSLPNAALINNQHKYDNYLPIMVMACRTTWFAQLRDRQLKNELSKNHGYKAGIYIIWLVAPDTTRQLYYTLTVYDRYYHNSRSVLRAVRGFTESQDPSDFMPEEDNYLLLRDSEVLELMSIGDQSFSSKHKQKRGIPMELIVFENPLKPVQDRDSDSKIPRTKGSVHRTVTGKVSLSKRPLSKTTPCM